MYLLYKSEIRLMILKLICHRTINIFEGEIIEIVNSSLIDEFFQVGEECTLTSTFIIDQNESLKELKENMYICLL